jgi:hypothetical protein
MSNINQQKYKNAFRPSSAQPNMLSHPCYQASLFNDNQRALGNIDAWKERMDREELRSNSQPQNLNANVQKDYQLKHVIWLQSVKQSRRLTLQYMENIDDLQIMALKRQKCYAMAIINDNRGKVSFIENCIDSF